MAPPEKQDEGARSQTSYSPRGGDPVDPHHAGCRRACTRFGPGVVL